MLLNRNRQVRDVDADPLAIEFLRRVNCRAAAAKRIENDIACVAARQNEAFQ